MLSTPYKTFEHSFFGTMIDKDDAQIIPDFFATNIENFIVRNGGEPEMRDGLTARGSSPSATNLGRGYLSTATGIKHLVRVLNGSGNTSKFQYSTNGTTWTDITGGGSKTTGAKWVMVQANDKLYAVNGIDTPIKYDGSSISTVPAIPNGTAIEWFKNHLWIFGNSTYRDRLYFSNPSDPETWGGSDYININLGDQSRGVGLKGQAGVSGRLYIGKERSVWFLTGTSSTDFAIAPLTYEHGVVSHDSMIQVENDVWCVDYEGNIRGLYRTTEDNPFSALRSEDIQFTIAGINKASLGKASAIYHNNFAMFFLPNGVDDYNSICLVYDTLANKKRGGWVKFTGWNIAGAVVFNQTKPLLYMFDSRTNNGQAYEWTGTSDNGVAITAKYETKIYDHGFRERVKKWKFATQNAPSIGTQTMSFHASVDRYYYTRLKEFSLQASGSLWGSMVWGSGTWGSTGSVRQRIGFSEGGGDTRGYTVQVKLEASSSTTKIKFRPFTMHYRVMGLK